MKKSILLPLILMFVIPLLFIIGTDQTAFALTYTKLTGGTATASSSSTSPALAFDSNTNTAWTSSVNYNNSVDQNIRYQVSSPKIVTKYKVASGSISGWSLQGSNNGSSWTVLHTSSQLGQEITISNTTAYTYYRITGSSVLTGYMQLPMQVPYPPYQILVQVPIYMMSVSELELWAQSPPATPTLAGPATDADGTYAISWGADPDATSYQLEENYNGGSWSTVYNSSGTSTSLTGRSPGTWNYRLKATNSVGSSAYSATITVLVAPLPPTPAGAASPNYTGSYTISWNTVTGASSYQLQENIN
ncbi:MAG: discoidin domain-containing protein, partial [Desulfatiglans sp.]|nr:discoidin domain-containing protein [Desulfatiglans sp.]